MKKTIIGIIVSLCTVVVCTFGSSVYADKPIGNYTYEYFTYNINSDDTITLISCNNNISDVTIPAEINGMPVSSINGSTFQDCNSLENISVSDDSLYFCVNNAGMLMNKSQTRIIKCPQSLDIYSYSIPENVKYISPYCFENCKALEMVVIPETVTTIGKCAFKGTSFLNVTLSDNTVSIGEEAFGFNNSGKIEGFTLYGISGSAAETYAKDNQIAFTASDTELFNISINGNLYFYNSDISFSGDKINITTKNGDKAVFKFNTTPSKIYEEHGADITRIDILTILGNPITSVNVRVAMPGDSNADGKLNVRDAAYTASRLAKGQAFTGFEKMCADKNRDNKADIRDAAETARELANN